MITLGAYMNKLRHTFSYLDISISHKHMKKNIMIDNWKNLQDNKNCVKLDSEFSALY